MGNSNGLASPSHLSVYLAALFCYNRGPVETFLPISKEDLKKRGWDRLDIILVTGDAYVDHPSYGAAVIGRVLEREGYRVGVIAQPDWRDTRDFERLGKPRLFFGVTSGNMDSMVSNYTSHKKPRPSDDYSPGGKPGLRPDRAVIVYANRIRQAFSNVPIVIGGIEASLRRFAHYDWWDNSVRRSILLDSRADILVYGMGETQAIEIARRIENKGNLEGIRGTAIVSATIPGLGFPDGDAGIVDSNVVEIPSWKETKESNEKFNEALRLIHLNQDPFRGVIIAQKHDNRFVIQYPPVAPFSTNELDAIYRLPFRKASHPVYDRVGGVPGFETVKFSLISHRGCPGQCSFCALFAHQGRIVQSRSGQSLLEEARELTKRKDFKGTITDIGGPTANLYKSRCPRWEERGTCRDRSCLTPTKCRNLRLGYRDSIKLYRSIMELPGVKHLFIESGLRYDLLVDDESDVYLEQVCRHQVGGQMKIAPEHTVDHVLDLMNKPSFHVYERFAERFKTMQKKTGKNQYMVHYIISSHPGETLEDVLTLSLTLMKKGIYPEQIQDFMPLPLTLAGAAYHTETDPMTGAKVFTAKTFQERKMHRALIQYRYPKNRELVRQALHILGREDLLPRFSSRSKK